VHAGVAGAELPAGAVRRVPGRTDHRTRVAGASERRALGGVAGERGARGHRLRLRVRVERVAVEERLSGAVVVLRLAGPAAAAGALALAAVRVGAARVAVRPAGEAGVHARRPAAPGGGDGG